MAKDDMTVICGDGLINIRVGAIIMKHGKFLMTCHDGADYLFSVGGRVKFGETAEEAVVREVYEETGVRLEVDRLGFVQENYFRSDLVDNGKRLIYEVSFFFYMKVPSDFEPVRTRFSDGGRREFLTWIAPDDKRTIYPDFFRTELSKPSEFVKHFVKDER